MGLSTVWAATMASGDSIVSFFDTKQVYYNVCLEIPSMPSSTALDIYVAATSTAFYQARRAPIGTSTAQFNTFTIAASCAANGSNVPLPGGFKYYKIIATDSAPTAATTFKIICSDC